MLTLCLRLLASTLRLSWSVDSGYPSYCGLKYVSLGATSRIYCGYLWYLCARPVLLKALSCIGTLLYAVCSIYHRRQALRCIWSLFIVIHREREAGQRQTRVHYNNEAIHRYQISNFNCLQHTCLSLSTDKHLFIATKATGTSLKEEWPIFYFIVPRRQRKGTTTIIVSYLADT